MNSNNSLLEEYKENGYCVVKDHKSIVYPKTERILKDLTEIGKSIDPNFDLSNPKSVGSANKKNFWKAMKYCVGLYDLAVTQEIVNLAKKLNCKIPTPQKT